MPIMLNAKLVLRYARKVLSSAMGSDQQSVSTRLRTYEI